MSSDDRVFYLGAVITSLTGAILLFATDFCGFNGSNYYLGVYIWGGIGASTEGYGAIFIIMGIMLIFTFLVALISLGAPDLLPSDNFVKLSFLFSFIVFLLSIIGLIVFGAIAEDEGWWWWPDAGFYGGAIGGLLSTLFFYMAYREM